MKNSIKAGVLAGFLALPVVEELPLLYDGSLPSGRFPGEFVLHFYNESGDEEVVNTKLKVDVYIK